jgi:hypothetical protein
MKTIIAGTALAVVALAASQLALAQNNPSRTLDITWIDVEGGAATLLVVWLTPATRSATAMPSASTPPPRRPGCARSTTS